MKYIHFVDFFKTISPIDTFKGKKKKAAFFLNLHSLKNIKVTKTKPVEEWVERVTPKGPFLNTKFPIVHKAVKPPSFHFEQCHLPLLKK